VSGMSQGLERQPLGERAYAVIKEMIITRELGPGEQVPETVLANRLGISRSPVKAALTRLQGEGLIVGEAWKVPRVAPLDAEYVDNVYQVMVVLDALCARQCVSRVPKEAIDAFSDELDAAREVMKTGDFGPLLDAHVHFNQLLVEYCGNELLKALEARLQDHLARVRHSSPRNDNEWPRRDDGFLGAKLDALRDRDAERLAAMVSEHLQAFRAHILAHWVDPEPAALVTVASE
jgi:DNA-binding GntR family transcriptional regulator